MTQTVLFDRDKFLSALRCSKCHRPIRDVKSLSNGMGPVCFKRATDEEKQAALRKEDV